MTRDDAHPDPRVVIDGDDPVDRARRAADVLQAVYGDRLVRVVLYGSQARGDADRESDLDLLAVLWGPVDGTEEHDRLADALWALTLELGQVVSVLPISEEGARRDTPLLRNIAREGIVVT